MLFLHKFLVVVFWVALVAALVFRHRCQKCEEGSEEYAWNLKMKENLERVSMIVGIVNLALHFMIDHAL
ncbi:hypothetical protein [Selenomonas sp. KH1T6]|uniref:hypothetical protein n=1 Tax=Selenomonas sp. KH1T6 TaxID=3158784 RepID=UPI0008A79956|nr:hypothetical protein SAMN05216583_10622 [Selenomonas ruminantium]